MKDTVLVDRYTSSLFSLASEGKDAQAVYKSMQKVFDTLGALDGYKKLALSEQVPTKLKAKIWDATLDACGAPHILKSFVKLLLENRRIYLFSKIINKFNTLLLTANGIKLVRISTSFALSAAEKKKLTTQLEEICKQKVMLDDSSDEELLGGMILQIDSFMLDASIKSKLANIKTTLLS